MKSKITGRKGSSPSPLASAVPSIQPPTTPFTNIEYYLDFCGLTGFPCRFFAFISPSARAPHPHPKHSCWLKSALWLSFKGLGHQDPYLVPENTAFLYCFSVPNDCYTVYCLIIKWDSFHRKTFETVYVLNSLNPPTSAKYLNWLSDTILWNLHKFLHWKYFYAVAWRAKAFPWMHVLVESRYWFILPLENQQIILFSKFCSGPTLTWAAVDPSHTYFSSPTVFNSEAFQKTHTHTHTHTHTPRINRA